MDFIQARELFKNSLLGLHRSKLHSGGTKVSLPCPICGDTNENHFHIHIPSKEDDMIFYKCFRSVCNAKGVLNSNILRDLGIYSPDILNFVKTVNGNLKDSNVRRYNKWKGYQINNYSPKVNSELNKEKMAYINNRLGLSLSANEIAKLKIVISFNDLLYYNKLNLSDFSDKRAWYLEYNTIGFISRDGTHCTFRDVNKKSYVAYNLLGVDNGEKHYIIPTKLDIMKPVNVYIAEGPFDILSAYYNIDGLDKENSIWVATCGASSYENIIKSMIRLGIFNATYHIFSDQDVTIDFYRNLKKKIGAYKFFNPINIYYNRLGKDIGVRKEEIDLIQTQI